jgi:glycosyltransferase involved in cell wall biosynthesis
MAQRAAQFSARLAGSWEIHTIFRNANGTGRFQELRRGLKRIHPELVYVLDMGAAGTIAGLEYKLRTRVPVIIDTGDVIHAVSKTLGRGSIGVFATWMLEKTGLRFADHIVVRGTFHRDHLARLGIDATVIHDGVNVEEVSSKIDPEAKAKKGLTGKMTFGVVGSLQWNSRTATCYGMEVIEALGRLKDLPVAAVVIGDGVGLPRLKKVAADLDIEARVTFTGRQTGDDLYRWLSAIDVCVSTQTNDLVGQVRTTGKLPLYMAAGRYVLATDVGEARLVLDEDMLIPYSGSHDPHYTDQLAARLTHLCHNQELLTRGTALMAVAERRFSYDKLSVKLDDLFARTLSA